MHTFFLEFPALTVLSETEFCQLEFRRRPHRPALAKRQGDRLRYKNPHHFSRPVAWGRRGGRLNMVVGVPPRRRATVEGGGGGTELGVGGCQGAATSIIGDRRRSEEGGGVTTASATSGRRAVLKGRSWMMGGV
jgi:hypothetical protein